MYISTGRNTVFASVIVWITLFRPVHICSFSFIAPLNIRRIAVTSKTPLRERKDATMSESERAEALQKATQKMTAFSNRYSKVTETKYCSDLSIPAVVIKGLAEHKVTLGTPLCPCRYYEDKEAEAKDGYWNCPCVPMRERHECHCMLFLTEENDFAGEESAITYDDVIKHSQMM
uniref:ferredoxin:thioredoxin reductase n=1 Tax=Corethron hystrix TaxID=216773 RepID=A0A7S1FWH7_9STRA|mmetsp:Transcript_34890/g.80695  ORF Transcript_34890/g.80695 Transcript_34890/m.80695 type:complete len:175 (+) Transcript_34890:134-658(+)